MRNQRDNIEVIIWAQSHVFCTMLTGGAFVGASVGAVGLPVGKRVGNFVGASVGNFVGKAVLS